MTNCCPRFRGPKVRSIRWLTSDNWKGKKKTPFLLWVTCTWCTICLKRNWRSGLENFYFSESWAKFPSSESRADFPPVLESFSHVFFYFSLQITQFLGKDLLILSVFPKPVLFFNYYEIKIKFMGQLKIDHFLHWRRALIKGNPDYKNPKCKIIRD